jgi:Lipocalin-like domain
LLLGSSAVAIFAAVGTASAQSETGTADENKEAVKGILSFFGTYTVDEAAKTIDVRVEGDSLPNNEGSRARWLLVAEITGQPKGNED